MSDRIDSAESAASSAMKMATLAGLEASGKQSQLVSGSNIKTINHQSILGSGNIIVDTDKVEKYKTKDDLDANGSLAGGDIAAVVDALLVEKPFTECYQPTRSEIETDPYNKKFTKVDGLVLNPDFNPNLISSNYGHLSVRLYSDGKSKGYHKEYPSHLEIECDYNRRIICWEYDGTSGSGHTLYDSAGFNAAKIDRVNNILREGDFRFSYFEATYREDVNVNSYTYYYSYNDNFPADATATIDSFVKMLFAETQNADIYVRSAEWVKLLKDGDVTGGESSGKVDRVIYGFNTDLTAEHVESNKETYRLFSEGKASITILAGGVFFFTPNRYYHYNDSFVFVFVYDAYQCGIILNEDGTVEYESDLIVDSELSDTSENAVQNKVIKAYVDEKVANVGGSEIREFYTGDSLTEEQKAWNLETAMMVEEKKCTTVFKVTASMGILPAGTTIPLSAFVDRTFLYVFSSGVNAAFVSVTIDSDGNSDITAESVSTDNALSSTSTNAVQNKVVTSALNSKADKTYVDSAIAEAITNTINTPV